MRNFTMSTIQGRVLDIIKSKSGTNCDVGLIMDKTGYAESTVLQALGVLFMTKTIWYDNPKYEGSGISYEM